MQHPKGIALISFLIIVVILAALGVSGYVLFSQPTTSVNTAVDAVNATNAAANIDGTNVQEGVFPPVNEDPNANTNLANISPQTNVNTQAVSRKSCTVDSDCGLLMCSGCFSNTYLQIAPPDLACRTYDGYACAEIAPS